MRAGDQMFHSLRAVAGVAAMTNSEYDEIGNIFTKVAGQSRLMGDDLLSLSSRGMNAAASISTYFNSSKENLDKFYEMYSSTAKKTDEQIKRGTQSTEKYVRTMISNGAMDFQTFAEAMDSCFGEHAKKANETFTGALSNIRAALARIGALFISPLVEQNGSLVKMFNAIRQRINDVKSSIQPLADLFVKAVTSMADRLTAFLEKLDIKTPLSKLMSGLVPAWDQFSAKLESAGISVTDFQSKLTEVASTHGVSVDELITKYGSLGKAISSGKISNDIIVETLKNFISTGQEVSVVTDNITNKWRLRQWCCESKGFN